MSNRDYNTWSQNIGNIRLNSGFENNYNIDRHFSNSRLLSASTPSIRIDSGISSESKLKTYNDGQTYKVEIEIKDFSAHELKVSTQGRKLIINGDSEVKDEYGTKYKKCNREINLPDDIDLNRSTTHISDNNTNPNYLNVAKSVCSKVVFQAPIINKSNDVNQENPLTKLNSNYTTGNSKFSDRRRELFDPYTDPPREQHSYPSNQPNNPVPNSSISHMKDFDRRWQGMTNNFQRLNSPLNYVTNSTNTLFDKVKQFLNDGKKLYDQGKGEQAIDCYEKAISIKPSPDAYNYKGLAFEYLKNYDDAVKCYDEAIKLDPFNKQAKFNKNSVKKLLEVEKTVEKDDVLRSTAGSTINNNSYTYDIFISYSWSKKTEAKNLFHLLTKKKFKCWMDDNQLLAGNELYDDLMNAILASRLVLLCISDGYLKSDNCFREFYFSMSHKDKKFIIPIKFDSDDAFGTWPPVHKMFFMLADSIYIANIYKHIQNMSNELSQEVSNFLTQLRQKLQEQ